MTFFRRSSRCASVQVAILLTARIALSPFPGLPGICGRGSQLAQRCPRLISPRRGDDPLAAHFGVEVSATNPTSPKPKNSLSRLNAGRKIGAALSDDLLRGKIYGYKISANQSRQHTHRDCGPDFWEGVRPNSFESNHQRCQRNELGTLAPKMAQVFSLRSDHAAVLAASNEWETIVREQCGLGRSRAYELMAIADGKTTLEKVRATTNERKKVHRAKSESVPERTEPTDDDDDDELTPSERAERAVFETAHHLSPKVHLRRAQCALHPLDQ
jgi:hypothetical protein